MAVAKADTDAIVAAAKLLQCGRLVAFPTETVYGLGADASNGEAVAQIFAAKGRPQFNPLIVHVANIATAERLAHMGDLARRMAEAFWPGPLTLVLQRRDSAELSDLVTAGLDTVAVRMPDHPVAQRLLAATGRPLAAPSANRSGHVSPTLAQHVADDLGDRVAMVLDGGPTTVGIESTIVNATGARPVMLRAGSVPADAIEAALGLALERALHLDGALPKASGQLASHYAPRAQVRLNVTDGFAPGEAVLAFGRLNSRDASGPWENLSERGDLVEAAANLFAALRRLDAAGVGSIAVTPIPAEGLGEAINDRLRRAAAPR